MRCMSESAEILHPPSTSLHSADPGVVGVGVVAFSVALLFSWITFSRLFDPDAGDLALVRAQSGGSQALLHAALATSETAKELAKNAENELKAQRARLADLADSAKEFRQLKSELESGVVQAQGELKAMNSQSEADGSRQIENLERQIAWIGAMLPLLEDLAEAEASRSAAEARLTDLETVDSDGNRSPQQWLEVWGKEPELAEAEAELRAWREMIQKVSEPLDEKKSREVLTQDLENLRQGFDRSTTAVNKAVARLNELKEEAVRALSKSPMPTR